MAKGASASPIIHKPFIEQSYQVGDRQVKLECLFGDPRLSHGDDAWSATHYEVKLSVGDQSVRPSVIDSALARFDIYFRGTEEFSAPCLANSIAEDLNRQLEQLSRIPVVSPVVSQTP